ncbi:MAG: beta-lactamase family protein [Devosiaceae bacterium]|nr:beta-lactamase family protein [Devosiaceae bacterium MH13]
MLRQTLGVGLALTSLCAALALPTLADTDRGGAPLQAIAAERSVIVARRDQLGNVDVESALSVDARGGDALVDLGSITKTVTAIATLHLLETYGLSPHTALAGLLPEVPADKASITVYQLLTHTSGLVESTGDDAEPLGRQAFLGRVLSAPLEAAPGARHAYSNAGYSVLAAIIEHQSGLRFEDYLIDRVIPEGAPAIGYARAYEAARSMTSARVWRTGFRRQSIARASWGGEAPGWNLIGNGGLVTTAEGFVSLWAAFLAGEIVSDALVAAALTAHADEGQGDTFYGYGLVVEAGPAGNTVFWHDGGNEIFSAEWRHDIASGTSWFVAGRGHAAFGAMDALMAGGAR